MDSLQKQILNAPMKEKPATLNLDAPRFPKLSVTHHQSNKIHLHQI